MKSLILGIVILVFIVVSCKSITETYTNENDVRKCRVELNKNNTYLFICSGHIYGTHWSYGSWNRKKDTLYFSKKYLYDTIRFLDKDTLIPSLSIKPKLTVVKRKSTKNEFFLHNISMELSIHPQKGYFIFPKSKLVIKDRKLFEIKNAQELDSDYYAK